MYAYQQVRVRYLCMGFCVRWCVYEGAVALVVYIRVHTKHKTQNTKHKTQNTKHKKVAEETKAAAASLREQEHQLELLKLQQRFLVCISVISCVRDC